VSIATSKLVRRPLVEQRALEFAPLASGQHRVDRDQGIIYGVKVVGRTSPNTHGVRGATGTEYTLEALQGALALYEGINVNVDHPDRDRPRKDRSARDRFAWLESCQANREGIFGDLHFLDPTDPLATKILNAAERHPEAFALSHNALGQGEVKGGRYVVTQIPEVRSVDIVADGGTNRSLFESKNLMTTTLRQLIESSKVNDKLKAQLLEMGDMMAAPMMDDEMAAPVDPAAGEGAGDWKADLVAAIGKLVSSEDPEQHSMGLKIMKLLKPGAPVADPGEEVPDDVEPTKESRGQRDAGKGEVVLNEARAQAMCKTAGVEATHDVLEAIKGATFDQALAVINLAKRAAAPSRTSAPRSSSPQRITGDGTAPRDAKGWAEKLLS
jgi:hypothetical protein